MKKFSDFMLQEDLTGALVEPQSASSAQAKKLGLQYVGFGRYADPQTNQVTHIVQNDRLVPFSKAVKTNTFKKDSGDDFGSYTKNLMPDIQTQHGNLASSYPPEKYDDAELDAIQAYTQGAYVDINNRLATLPTGVPADQIQPQGPQDTIPNQIAALDSALNKVPVASNFTVFTSLNSSYTPDMFQTGQEFAFKGYRSTSLNPNIALNFDSDKGPKGQLTVLQINVRKGSKGMYVDEYSSNPGESEYLLPRGSKLKVNSGPHVLQGSNAFTQDQNLNVTLFICDLVK